jgi:hypothetical protein
MFPRPLGLSCFKNDLGNDLENPVGLTLDSKTCGSVHCVLAFCCALAKCYPVRCRRQRAPLIASVLTLGVCAHCDLGQAAQIPEVRSR